MRDSSPGRWNQRWTSASDGTTSVAPPSDMPSPHPAMPEMTTRWTPERVLRPTCWPTRSPWSLASWRSTTTSPARRGGPPVEVVEGVERLLARRRDDRRGESGRDRLAADDERSGLGQLALGAADARDGAHAREQRLVDALRARREIARERLRAGVTTTSVPRFAVWVMLSNAERMRSVWT